MTMPLMNKMMQVLMVDHVTNWMNLAFVVLMYEKNEREKNDVIPMML